MSDKEQSPLPGACPDLDKLVAAKMGYEWLILKGAFGDDIGRWVIPGTQASAYDMMERHENGLDQPQYSTSWEAAMQIADFVWVKNFTFKLKHEKFAGWWECEIRNGLIFGWERKKTGPMAICAAFLALPDFEVKP